MIYGIIIYGNVAFHPKVSKYDRIPPHSCMFDISNNLMKETKLKEVGITPILLFSAHFF